MISLEDLEAKLREVELWKPGDAKGNDVQARIDWLDEQLSLVDPATTLYRRSFRRFRALCRQSQSLPSACIITTDIHVDGAHPLHQTALSDVYEGHFGSQKVALKSLRIHGSDREKVEKAFFDEVAIWRCLRHPNVVPFLGAANVLPVCLVSKWMVHGDIGSFLRTRPREIRTPYLRQILDGLAFIHSLDIVHGDLKAANILVDSNFNACLSDFGLTTLLHSTGANTYTTTSSGRGTLRWMAPELLLADGSDPNDGRPSQASDMYALGMVIWELFTNRIPFDHILSEYRILMDVSSGVRPSRPEGAEDVGFTELLWVIMQACWQDEPDQRPLCPEVAQMLVNGSVSVNSGVGEVYKHVDGIYELIDDKTKQVLDLGLKYGELTGEVMMWEAHAGDNQRWIIEKHNQEYSISSVVDPQLYLSSTQTSKRSPDELAPSSNKQRTLWTIQPIPGRRSLYRLIDKESERELVALPAYPGTPYVHPAVLPVEHVESRGLQTQWRFELELFPVVDIEGTFRIVNVETGNPLETVPRSHQMPQLSTDNIGRTVPTRWVVKRTKRGHSIYCRNNGYVALDGRKPALASMRLSTTIYEQTWMLEAVDGYSEGNIFRIYWPDMKLAIGVGLPLWRQWNGRTKQGDGLSVALHLISGSEKAPGLDWRFEELD